MPCGARARSIIEVVLTPEPTRSAASQRRLTFVEVVESLRTQLAAFAHAPHEEHPGPLCPICGLVGNLRKALEDYSDA